MSKYIEYTLIVSEIKGDIIVHKGHIITNKVKDIPMLVGVVMTDKFGVNWADNYDYIVGINSTYIV